MTEQLRPTDPRSVGPYRLTGRLGQGGMGDVFLGRSAGGRLVAVKVIRADLAADHEFRARFRHEVEAARQVNGLYTAPVADADVDGAVPWLATAYVPGPSLATAIEEHGPLPARSLLALAAGLAEGLAAIHAAGLIHRDIKPSNVLLAADGPRVIDFGIARGTQSTVLTLAGRVIGSPDYMSPEQASGRGIGPPSDMFSLGAVLLFAATGQPPFDGGMTTVLERIVTDSPDLSRVPAEVRPLIEWCMRKEPSQRPTPQALLNRLGGISLWDDWLPESLLADIPGDRVTAVSPARSRHDDTRTTESPAAGLTAFGRQDRGEGDPGLRSRPATDPDRNDAAAGPRPRPARHRGRRRGGRRMWLIASAASLVVLAAVGGGLWLALGNGHKIPVTQPSASRSAAPEVSSPYKLTVSGVTEDACSAGLSSANGRAASITFTDKAKTQLRVYWLNYFGKRSLLVTLTPNESRQIKGNVGDAWQVADLHGCVAEFASTSTGSVTIEAAATP